MIKFCFVLGILMLFVCGLVLLIIKDFVKVCIWYDVKANNYYFVVRNWQCGLLADSSFWAAATHLGL